MIINGKRIPERLKGWNYVDGIMVSPDGKKYAVLENEGFEIYDVPENGIVEVNDITVHLGSNTVIGRGSVVIGGSSSGNVIITGKSSTSTNSIAEEYSGVEKLVVNGTSQSVFFGIREENSLYVEGNVEGNSKNADYQNSILFLKRFEGRIYLPKTSDLELVVTLTSGDISGKIAHKGTIKTTSGSVSLELYHPINVIPTVTSGEINIEGMIKRGNIYYPPENGTKNSLVINTTSGDIEVIYKL